MANANRIVPTSIRLKSDSTAFIEEWQTATGWSVSRLLDLCVRLTHRVLTDDKAGMRLYREMLQVAAEEHAVITHAETVVTQAKSRIRKAVAAASEAK
jgi:hypothetical protein